MSSAFPGQSVPFGACLDPIPPLPRPDVCVNRSRIVTCRSAGTSSTLPSFSTATFRSLKSGMYFETGSASRILPSSTSIMTATPVTGLVEEAMRKRASVVMGLPASASARPWAARWTTFPLRATSVTAPAM